MKLFQMMSQDLDTLQMVILKTLSSEKAWEAVFKARDYEGIITDMRAQIWSIGLREKALDLLKTVGQGNGDVSECDRNFSSLAKEQELMAMKSFKLLSS